MTLRTFAAVVAIVALPVLGLPAMALPAMAQAQQKAAPKATKADAQRVVKIIKDDKAKTQTYCEIANLGEQIDQADQKKDSKKMDELAQKADELGAKIGPEYVALMDSMQDMDPNSKDSEEIGAMLDELDKLCGK